MTDESSSFARRNARLQWPVSMGRLQELESSEQDLSSITTVEERLLANQRHNAHSRFS